MHDHRLAGRARSAGATAIFDGRDAAGAAYDFAGGATAGTLDDEAFGDFDGDGLVDHCTFDGASTVSCARGQGYGFGPAFPIAGLAGTPILGDVDGDGIADLCAASATTDVTCALGVIGTVVAGRIAVVDAETNRFVRWEARRAIHEQHLVHRSIHVLVFDRAGRLLVQRRHATKQTYPRYWDTSCAGHVEESDYTPGGPDAELDRVYEEVARRELHEELGIAVDTLAPIARIGPIANIHYEWIALYRAESARARSRCRADEVEEVRVS